MDVDEMRPRRVISSTFDPALSMDDEQQRVACSVIGRSDRKGSEFVEQEIQSPVMPFSQACEGGGK